MKAMKQIYAIPLPTVQDGSYSLQFPAKIAGESFMFLFKWLPATLGTVGSWQIFVTLPTGEIRGAGCVPGVVSWTAYPDYGLEVTSDLASVGQNDLSRITLYWIVWA